MSDEGEDVDASFFFYKKIRNVLVPEVLKINDVGLYITERMSYQYH